MEHNLYYIESCENAQADTVRLNQLALMMKEIAAILPAGAPATLTFVTEIDHPALTRVVTKGKLCYEPPTSTH